MDWREVTTWIFSIQRNDASAGTCGRTSFMPCKSMTRNWSNRPSATKTWSCSEMN